jgi:hypothetical protein
LRRLKPRNVLPVHHDDYRVFRSPLGDFVQRAHDHGLGDLVTRIERGQSVELQDPPVV